jgi:drug/metabolite transporter (DMT)-like permease
MLGLGAAVLASGLLGRFAGWSAIVLGVAGLAVVVTASSLDANPMPFLLGLLWVLVASVRLAWRGPRRVRVVAADELAPALA